MENMRNKGDKRYRKEETWGSIMINCIALVLCSLVLITCNNQNDYPNNCRKIRSFEDSILINNEKVFVIVNIGKFDNRILASSEIIVAEDVNLECRRIQFKSSENCWETDSFIKMYPPRYQAYETGNVPNWTIQEKTQAIIELSINSKTYFLRDIEVNK